MDRVELPSPGQHVCAGENLASLLQGSRELRLVAPVDGTVVQVNRELAPDGLFIWSEPYGAGWICEIKPESLSKDLRKLMIADQAVEWHTKESRKMRAFCSRTVAHEAGTETVEPEPSSLRGFLQDASDDQWREFQSRFLKPGRGGTVTDERAILTDLTAHRLPILHHGLRSTSPRLGPPCADSRQA